MRSLVLVGCLALAAHGAGKSRVLFLGNSYTYQNDLPWMVAELARRAGHSIDVAAITPGGATLEQHWNEKDAVKVIRKRSYDFVVLQEQSQRPLEDPKKMAEFVERFSKEIRRREATTVLFLTWARRDKPKTQAELTRVYREVAKKVKARIAPVGPAWAAARKKRPELALHQKDGSHPAPAGSYLAACVFYAVLTQKSPVGLPHTLQRDKKTVLKLKQKDALLLQQIAWDTVARFPSEG